MCSPRYNTQMTSSTFSIVFIAPDENDTCKKKNSAASKRTKIIAAVVTVACVLCAIGILIAILVLRRMGYIRWFQRSADKHPKRDDTSGTSFLLLQESAK